MKHKILIIEDEMSLSNILKLKFEEKKFDVNLVMNGKDGIKTAIKEKPDVILLELALENEDGFNILKKLKDDDEISQIPVIILTNSNKIPEVDRAFELGAVDYLLKSQIDVERVVHRVNTYITERKSK